MEGSDIEEVRWDTIVHRTVLERIRPLENKLHYQVTCIMYNQYNVYPVKCIPLLNVKPGIYYMYSFADTLLIGLFNWVNLSVLGT